MSYPTGMPSVTVHYFATLREKQGSAQESVALKGPETVAELYNRLFPPQGTTSVSVGFAVNRQHCRGETLLNDGDEVAFIPPVGGG